MVFFLSCEESERLKDNSVIQFHNITRLCSYIMYLLGSGAELTLLYNEDTSVDGLERPFSRYYLCSIFIYTAHPLKF